MNKYPSIPERLKGEPIIYNLQDIRGGAKNYELIVFKRVLVYMLRKIGFTNIELARFYRNNHATIINLIKKHIHESKYDSDYVIYADKIQEYYLNIIGKLLAEMNNHLIIMAHRAFNKGRPFRTKEYNFEKQKYKQKILDKLESALNG